MKKQTKTNRQGTSYTMIVCLVLLTISSVFAQENVNGKYKSGDRVECEVTGNPKGKWWTKGTIQPFKDGDFGAGIEPDGSWYRFKADANKVEYYCKPEVLRPLAGGAGATTKPAEKTKEPAQVEKTAETGGGDFVACPVEQTKVKNGARPDAELLKKIIRCKKGEKAVEKGDEGAVKVEISALQIGDSRPWSYRQDAGNGQLGTVVYPVKATYTVKTFYRTATEVEEGWMRILNFYVNAFGEWQIGSEETVKSPKVQRIPK